MITLGRTQCTYEPAMTKAFLPGRTEAIRTVQPESVEFTKVCLTEHYPRNFRQHIFSASSQTFFSDADPTQKIKALKKACERHVTLTKECSKGLGQDRYPFTFFEFHRNF